MGKRLAQKLHKRGYPMAKPWMKRCSSSLVTRKMPMKATRSYHYTTIRGLKWESQTGSGATGTGRQINQNNLFGKLTISTEAENTQIYDLAIPLLNIYSIEIFQYVHQKARTRIFITSKSPKFKTIQMPVTSSIDNLRYIHTTGRSAAMRMNHLHPHGATGVNVTSAMLRERNQPQRSMWCIILFTKRTKTGKMTLCC